MFLLYRNQGVRRYGSATILPYPREVWEFQFIASGDCSFLVRDKNVTTEKRIKGPVLCVTGPDFVHGYGGEATDICEIICFHFDEVDFAVRSLVGTAGHRILPFSKSELTDVQALYDRCGEASKEFGKSSPPEAQKRAGILAPRIYEIVGLELTIFILRHVQKSELSPTPDFDENKVSQALAWYGANLTSGPSIEEVAHAVHLSPTHLRRLFHKVRGVSPQTAFTGVQFERVKWLMNDFSMALERVGELSGFGSASAFSRAFKREFKVSPKEFRESLKRNKSEEIS